MIIKPSKNYLIVIGGCFLAALIILTYLMYDEPKIIACFCIILSFFSFRLGVCYGRTLVMNESGCTVCFGGIKKKYLWKELKIKRIESFNGDRAYYDEGVIFSANYIRKPIWYSPISYSFWIHPFSFFFVYFRKPPKALPEGKKYGKIKASYLTFEYTEDFSVYAVDEEEFLIQMKAWGVELEDTRRKYRRRYY